MIRNTIVKTIRTAFTDQNHKITDRLWRISRAKVPMAFASALLLWADPLGIRTLPVQAQVELMEDGTLFDPVWYAGEYPEGAGAKKLAEKKADDPGAAGNVGRSDDSEKTSPAEETEGESSLRRGKTDAAPAEQDSKAVQEEKASDGAEEESKASFLQPGMTTEEIYREYQLYGQAKGQLPYDEDAQNGTMLEEMKKAAAAVKRRKEAQYGPSWETITARISDTSEVTIWDTEYLISDQDSRKLADIIDEFESNGYEIGFVMVDVKTGDALSYHAGAEIYSASVIKAPYIFSLLESGITPTRDMFLAGNQSDNDAYQRIRRAYGNQVFADWIAGTGIPEKQSQTRYIVTTPLDLCRMFYKGTGLLLGEEEYSDWARNTFTNSLNSAIALTVGEDDAQDKKVYSKAGWIASDGNSIENSYTNGAIVDGDYPYVVTIMSNSPGYIGIEYAKELMPILDEIHDEMVNPDAAVNTGAKASELTDFAKKAQSMAGK